MSKSVGQKLSMPQSRPLPTLGRRCHELRVNDKNQIWRIIYRIDEDAIVILEVFSKKSKTIPKAILDTCKARLRQYDELS